MRLLPLLLLVCASLCNAEFAVVVDRDSSIEALEASEVRRIFLGKTNHFPNGDRAKPVEVNNSELRRQFYRQISGKTLSQLNAYWATLLFTGKGRPPQVVEDVEALVEQLPRQPGTITYVPSGEVSTTMKIVYSSGR